MFCAIYFTKVPSKAFGMTHKMSRIDAEPNRNFWLQYKNFHFLLERDNDMKFLQSLNIKIIQVFLIFQIF